MAQDKKTALDEKTRKLSGERIEKGKEHAAYQETQQQLLAIQAEQQQNLAVARAESKASFNNNQTLAQAAELGAISAAEAEQAAQTGEQVTLNPATQSILTKYGVGQPKFKKTSSHSQQVTKQNIIINNNITSNTTNDVKVPANLGGPLQGRPLQFKTSQTSSGQNSVGRFKNWISATFARQNEEGAKRDREYRQRESSLTKSANRMLKKLGEIGKTIGTRMDPRKIGSTWQSQLKTLLLLFGFGYLTSNWTKILAKVAKIENWVKETWGYFTGKFGEGQNSFISDIKSFIGGNNGESIWQSLGNLLLGDDGLWGKIKEFFTNLYEDRAKAVKEIKFPTINFSSAIDTIKALGEYLGDVLGALVGGSEYTKKAVARQADRETAETQTRLKRLADSKTKKTLSLSNESGEEFKGDAGVMSLVNGTFKGHTRYSLNSDGTMNSERPVESSLAAATNVLRINKNITEKGDMKEASGMALDLSNLYKEAQRVSTQEKHGIPVPEEFIRLFNRKEIESLSKSKDIGYANYDVVLRKKSEEDLEREGLSSTRNGIDAYATATAHKMIYGDFGGSITNSTFGAGGFSSINPKLGGYIRFFETELDKVFDNDNRFELVRNATKNNPNYTYTGIKQKVYEVSPKVIQMITSKLSTGKTDNNINPEDKASIQKLVYAKGRSDRLSVLNQDEDKINKENIGLLRRAWKQRRINKEREKLEGAKTQAGGYAEAEQAIKRLDKPTSSSTTPNRWDTFTDNLKNKALDTYASASNTVYEWTGGAIGTQKLTVKQGDRAKYAVKRLMDEGLNREQASGVVGNMMKESGLNPKLGHTDSNGLHSGGIVQWNGPRYNAVSKFFGKPVEQVSFENQLEYVIKELKGEVGDGAKERSGFLRKHGFREGAKILDVMKTTTSLQDSTDTFERIFEGSGDFEGWTDKKTGVRHSGDRNKSRHVLAASVYEKTGGDLSNINFTEYTPSSSSSGSNEEKKEETGKSFLEILKEKVTEYITNFGGILGTAKDKLETAAKPITDVVDKVTDKIKETVFPKGAMYGGGITEEFTNYEVYQANQDNLPDVLPKGLTKAQWKNRVYDLTGSMPQNLDLREGEVKRRREVEEKKPELREDSKNILKKYTKEDYKMDWEKMNKESQENFEKYYASNIFGEDQEKYKKMIPWLEDPVMYSQMSEETRQKVMEVKKAEEERLLAEKKKEEDKEKWEEASKETAFFSEDDKEYRKKIPWLEDPILKNQLSESERQKILDVKKKDEDRLMAKEAKPEVEETKKAEVTELSYPKVDLLDYLNPDNFKKKDDDIRTIKLDLSETKALLTKILGVNSVNGFTSSKIVDAVNQGTMATANASRNSARAAAISEKNVVGKSESLSSSDKSYKQIT